MKNTFNKALTISLCAFPFYAGADGLLALDNPAKNGTNSLVYATAEAFTGNDQVAMQQYSANWQGDYSPGKGKNIGLLVARSEAGTQWSGYRLGALYRAEVLVEANRDTSDLAHQYLTSSGYDVGRTYQIDYQMRAFEADGAHLSKSFPFDIGESWQINYGIGVSLLHGMRVKIETASGQAATLNTQDFNANFTLNSMDSATDTSGGSQFNPPYGAHPSFSGHGYAFDLGVVLHREDGLRVEATVNDLAGRMEWINLPEYVANYNTATKYYDAEGYVHFNATGTAQSSYRNLSQTLEPKIWMALSYPIDEFEVEGASSYFREYWFPQGGAKYHINSQWQMKLDYDFRFSSIGFSIRNTLFFLEIRMANTSLDNAKAYGLNCGVNILF